MGLFERVGELLSANINDLIDKAENPLKTTRNLIRKIDEEIIALRSEVQVATGKADRLKKKMNNKQEDINLWSSRAEKSVSEDNDNLARQALSRKNDLEKENDELERKWWEATQDEKELKSKLKMLEDKAQQTRRRKESIIAKSRKDASSSDFLPIEENSLEEIDIKFKNREIEEELDNIKNRKNQ